MTSVLYVDDDPDDRLLVSAACRKAGVRFQLETAETGEEALSRLCGDAQARPALVLLDLKMPGKTGFDVLRALRASDATRDLFVVLYSSSMIKTDADRARAEGASLFVPKPGAFADLVSLAQAMDAYVTTGDTGPLEARALRASPG